MKTVREILNKKGYDVYTIDYQATVFDALKLMAEKEIGSVLAVDGENLVGILSERDYARKIALQGKFSKETKVNEIMSPKVIVVNLDNTVEECMALMSGKKIRHLPVVENEKLKGIVSIGDIVKAQIDEHEFVIDQLVQYIANTPSIIDEDLRKGKKPVPSIK